MIRDAIQRQVGYYVSLTTEGNLPDPDDGHERRHEDGDPATVAAIEGVQWIDEADDWDDDGPVW
jgi:hypothetical protein